MPSIQRRNRFRARRVPFVTTSYRTARALPPVLSEPPTKPTALPIRPTQSPPKLLVHRSLRAPTITADTLTVTLPVPPSVNHLYATVNGRRLLSSVGRSYKALVSQHVWLALTQSTPKPSFKTRLHSRPLALSIRFFFASALRRDLDGGLKIAQDALCEGLGLNDNRIIETHLYKHVDKVEPRIELSLSLLAPSDPS